MVTTVDLARLIASNRVALKFWGMVILLALRDRASEVRYEPSRGDRSLTYRVDGMDRDMVPPPLHMVQELLEALLEVSRPRGVRAFVVRTLRRFVRWVEGPLGSYTWFVARFEGEVASVTVDGYVPQDLGAVVLRLNLSNTNPEPAEAALRDSSGEKS